MHKSFWWWQYNDRYIISSPPPHLHSPFSPSLINLMVFVDIKHHDHVYLEDSLLMVWQLWKVWVVSLPVPSFFCLQSPLSAVSPFLCLESPFSCVCSLPFSMSAVSLFLSLESPFSCVCSLPFSLSAVSLLLCRFSFSILFPCLQFSLFLCLDSPFSCVWSLPFPVSAVMQKDLFSKVLDVSLHPGTSLIQKRLSTDKTWNLLRH